MNLPNSKRNKKGVNNFIFRGKSSNTPKNKTRILIEAILMLALGINLLVFLYTLPGEFVLEVFLRETWLDFSQGFIQLIDSILKIGGALVVILLIALGLILVLGALSRFLRLLVMARHSKKRKTIK